MAKVEKPQPQRSEYSKPSQEFVDAFVMSGSSSVDCDFCGRTHFAPDAGDFDDGELEELLSREKMFPRKYINHGDQTVSWGYLDGKQVVVDCPCNIISRYEKLFWNSRNIIERYFVARAKIAVQEAQRQKECSDSVSASVEATR